MIRVITIALALLVAACGEDMPAGPGGGGGGGGTGVECAESDNDRIRLLLAPSCEACHGEGASKPFFASLQAFEDLLTYDERFVVPGAPDQSLLLELLEGTATGAFTQMPLGGEPFAALDSQGQTDISIAELRTWIAELPPRSAGITDPDPRAVAGRLLRAEEIERTLMTQLGLDEERDFIQSRGRNHQSTTVILRGPYPMRSPDRPERLHYGNQRGAYERFTQLGGPNNLNGVQRRGDADPGFMVTLTQLSQAWCDYAINDVESMTLFPNVSPDDPSSSHANEIRENLRFAYFHMLGEEPSEADLDRYYNDLFLPYEMESSSRTAWVAVCSALVRDPLWWSY